MYLSIAHTDEHSAGKSSSSLITIPAASPMKIFEAPKNTQPEAPITPVANTKIVCLNCNKLVSAVHLCYGASTSKIDKDNDSKTIKLDAPLDIHPNNGDISEEPEIPLPPVKTRVSQPGETVLNYFGGTISHEKNNYKWTSPDAKKVDLSVVNWYTPTWTRVEAENFLSQAKKGAFVIRIEQAEYDLVMQCGPQLNNRVAHVRLAIFEHDDKMWINFYGTPVCILVYIYIYIYIYICVCVCICMYVCMW